MVWASRAGGFLGTVYTLSIQPGTGGAQPTSFPSRKHFCIGQQKDRNLHIYSVKVKSPGPWPASQACTSPLSCPYPNMSSSFHELFLHSWTRLRLRTLREAAAVCFTSWAPNFFGKIIPGAGEAVGKSLHPPVLLPVV